MTLGGNFRVPLGGVSGVQGAWVCFLQCRWTRVFTGRVLVVCGGLSRTPKTIRVSTVDENTYILRLAEVLCFGTVRAPC